MTARDLIALLQRAAPDAPVVLAWPDRDLHFAIVDVALADDDDGGPPVTTIFASLEPVSVLP